MFSQSLNDAHTRAAFPRRRWWERDDAPELSHDDPTDPPAPFRTGDRCRPDSSTLNDPNCRTFVPICGMRRAGAIVRNQGANAAWQLTVAPNVSEYFLPRAVRMQVTSNANPAIAQWVFITGVRINNFPQEGVHTVPALAGTTAGFSSQDYVAPDGYGVPVPWGIFSQGNLLKLLQINGFNFFGVAADVQLSVWGHPLSGLPTGYNLGTLLTEAQKDEIAATYAMVA